MVNMRSLIELGASVNSLSGEFPPALYNLSSLKLISLSFNKFRGNLRPDIGLAFPNLQRLYLANNYFTGSIPASLSNCSEFLRLDIPINNFTGSIPLSFETSRNCSGLIKLEFLDIADNKFEDIAQNKLGGSILKQVVALSSLSVLLNMSYNSLSGPLPVEIGNLTNLAALDILNNKLSGEIPLTGELFIPGNTLPNSSDGKYAALWGNQSAAFASMSQACRQMTQEAHCPHFSAGTREGYTKVSYEDLLNATGGFSSNNLIGSGSFGSVYRGSLSPKGTIVAVKGASKSFLAEYEALRNIRHRNLVRILTVCSSVDFDGNEFKALVYPFMENGSLDKWLHSKKGQMLQKRLSILHRLNITIDVASPLHYLHSQCHTPITHCDLKPSNVLLDNDLTAIVSDFCLAKFLYNSGQDADVNQFSSVGIKGTVGYAAPDLDLLILHYGYLQPEGDAALVYGFNQLQY
ncbi:hypothetical protein HAX54_000815 [Datura stramonium]|uniref:Protein kinase domain-containing protein n=1 Tax=Datura stramonium TaxID=4076 RepID=A0ABS8T1I9_DATST|nr:hypothetical protein [Datura stramonium]